MNYFDGYGENSTTKAAYISDLKNKNRNNSSNSPLKINSLACNLNSDRFDFDFN